jgi:hypothetical protein
MEQRLRLLDEDRMVAFSCDCHGCGADLDIMRARDVSRVCVP